MHRSPNRSQSPSRPNDSVMSLSNAPLELTSLDLRIAELDERIRRAKATGHISPPRPSAHTELITSSHSHTSPIHAIQSAVLPSAVHDAVPCVSTRRTDVPIVDDNATHLQQIRHDISRVKVELSSRYGQLHDTIALREDSEAKQAAVHYERVSNLAATVRGKEDEIAKTLDKARTMLRDAEAQTRVRDEMLADYKARSASFGERVASMDANEKQLVESLGALRGVVNDLSAETQSVRMEVSETDRSVAETQRERDRLDQRVRQLTVALGEASMKSERQSRNQIEDRRTLESRITELEQYLLDGLSQQKDLRAGLSDVEEKGRVRVDQLQAEKSAVTESLQQMLQRLAKVQQEIEEKDREATEIRKVRKIREEEELRSRLEERKNELLHVAKTYEESERAMRADKEKEISNLRSAIENAQKQVVGLKAQRDEITEQINVVESSLMQANSATVERESLRTRQRELEQQIAKLKEICSATTGISEQVEAKIRSTVDDINSVVCVTAKYGDVAAEEVAVRHRLTALQRELSDKKKSHATTRQQLESQAAADRSRLKRQEEEVLRMKTDAAALQLKLSSDIAEAQQAITSSENQLAVCQQKVGDLQAAAAQRASMIEEMARSKANLEAEVERRRREAQAAAELLLVRLQS